MESKRASAGECGATWNDGQVGSAWVLDSILTDGYFIGVYRINYTKRADKALRRMPRNIEQLIRSKVRALAVDPYAPNNNAESLKGSRYFRLRVGDWRVIYEIRDDEVVIVVLTIRPRGGAYR